MNMRMLFWAVLISACVTGCQKGFLDVRPSKSLVVPSSLVDFQQLLSNETVFNIAPALGEIGSDDYYTTAANLLAAGTPVEKNGYFWAQDVYQGSSVSDWNIPYEQVFYANVVLAGLSGYPTDSGSIALAEQLKATALFDRAYAFYNLAITFCESYRPDSASSIPGIPIRLSPDPNPASVRGTLQQTYQQVINDLNAALPLLPLATAVKDFPCKAAAYGLMARVYLDLQQYGQAGLYADSALQLNGSLMDYNQLSLAATYPFPKYNQEVLFESELYSYGIFYSRLTIVDSTLYASYDSNDLRKKAFFVIRSGNLNFKGTYSGVHTRFGGIATDEVYLIHAECAARQGNISGTMNDLNTLLVNRYVSGTFTPDSAASAEQALGLVLTERRKELIFRGIRWNDLRRLNQDPGLAVTLQRNINGQVYLLPPNDPRYTWPIPPDEIQASHISQNSR
jgi:tetratricopeptide (TPR) repeat protein